jgi:hypothetical protein
VDAAIVVECAPHIDANLQDKGASILGFQNRIVLQFVTTGEQAF